MEIVIKIKKILKTLNFIALHCIYSIQTHGKLVYLMFTPEHTNMGDSAITVAEKEMIEVAFPEYKIIEISLQFIYQLGGKALRVCCWFIRNNLLLLQGGGFLGNVWYECSELFIRILLENNKHSNMIILPQTIFYDDSQKAKQLFESSKIVYNACENLHICTREHFSYQLAKENYQNVYLFPDCVMYLTPEILKLSRNPHRKGVVTSLRQDVEKTRTEKEEQRIYSVLSKKFGGEIHNYDMLSDEPIPQEKRFEVVQGQMEHFRTAQLVVTDRLQGMIFSAVAETPCVVIKSQSYKVEGCYEWLKYLKYIKFIDNVENLEQACEEVLQVENATYNNECLMPYFSKLIDLMKKVESGEEICEIK